MDKAARGVVTGIFTPLMFLLGIVYFPVLFLFAVLGKVCFEITNPIGRAPTIEEISTRLQALGVANHVSQGPQSGGLLFPFGGLVPFGERLGLYEGPTRSRGELTIPEGPFRKVSITESEESDYDSTWVEVRISHWVPDIRVSQALAECRISTHRKRSPLPPWRFVHVSWRGDDPGQAIISRLNGDASLKQPVMEGGDIEIIAEPALPGWRLESEKASVPTRAQWECYLAIAGHVLATPMPYRGTAGGV